MAYSPGAAKKCACGKGACLKGAMRFFAELPQKGAVRFSVVRGAPSAQREAADRLRAGILPVVFPAGRFPPALPFVGG